MSSLTASSSEAPYFFPPPPALAHTLNSRGELGMFVNPYACSCVTCVDYVAAERAAESPLPCQSCRDHIREVSPDTPEGSVPLCREGPHCSPLLCDPCRGAYADGSAEPAAPAPAPAPAPSPASAVSAGAALGPAPANHFWMGDSWVHQDSPYARSPTVAPTLFPPDLGARRDVLLPPRSLGGGLTRSLTLGIGAGAAFGPSLVPSLGPSDSYALPTPTPASLTRSVTGYVEGPGLSNAAPAIAESDNESDDDDEADGAAAARPALPGLGPCSPEEESLLVRLSNLRLSYKARQDEVYSEAYRSHDEAAAQDMEWEDLDRKIDAIEELLRSFGVAIRDA